MEWDGIPYWKWAIMAVFFIMLMAYFYWVEKSSDNPNLQE